MSLRFFTDHCVPTSVIEALQGGGHEVLILKQHIPRNSDDADVIAKAQEIDAILVSLNGDFSDIVTYPPARFQGIIALQVQNHPEAIPSILRRLTNYLSANPDQQHYNGGLFLVESHRIRIRR
jgi:predicted nuclease of predicted toxin-antitoxin system